MSIFEICKINSNQRRKTIFTTDCYSMQYWGTMSRFPYSLQKYLLICIHSLKLSLKLQLHGCTWTMLSFWLHVTRKQQLAWWFDTLVSTFTEHTERLICVAHSSDVLNSSQQQEQRLEHIKWCVREMHTVHVIAATGWFVPSCLALAAVVRFSLARPLGGTAGNDEVQAGPSFVSATTVPTVMRQYKKICGNVTIFPFSSPLV